MSTTPLIDEQTEQHLRGFFGQRLQHSVDVTLYTGQENEDAVDFTRRFLRELAAIDARIQLREENLGDADRARGLVSPSVVLGKELGYAIEVHGAPSGHEAGALVETLGLLGSGDSELGADSRAKLAAVDKDVLLYSFVTPTCPHCPGSVLLNHKIAIEAKGKVRSVAVSAGENMELAQKFGVSSVPQQVINEDPDSATIGRQPEEGFVDQVLAYGASNAEGVLAAAREREAEKTRLVDAPTAPLTITDANFDEAVNKYPFLVVDCWAEWCGPCRMVGPIVEALAAEQAGTMVFGKLDTEANQRIPMEYQIRSIPTLLVFKDGDLVERIVGAMPKEALLAKLQTLL
ncbi:MAG: thioredoxin [Candidatus Krumholzibacteriia bacterium]